MPHFGHLVLCLYGVLAVAGLAGGATDSCTSGLPANCSIVQDDITSWAKEFDTRTVWDVFCHTFIKDHDIGEMANFPLYKPNITDCIRLCNEEERECEAVVYIFGVRPGYGNCFLKHSQDVTPLSHVDMPINVTKNGLVAPKPLPKCVQVVTVKRHVVRCVNDSIEHVPRNCSEVVDNLTASGFPENDWDIFCDIDMYQASDLGSYEAFDGQLRNRSIQQCAQVCKENGQICKGFTYIYGRIGKPDQNCYLKGSRDLSKFALKTDGFWSEQTGEVRCITTVSVFKVEDKKPLCFDDVPCKVAFAFSIISFCVGLLHVLIACYLARHQAHAAAANPAQPLRPSSSMQGGVDKDLDRVEALLKQLPGLVDRFAAGRASSQPMN